MSDLLITGVYGQLGKALDELAHRRGLTTVGHDLDTLDITDREAVAACITRVQPRAVVNCAAFTAVDRCEEEEEELATAVNGTAIGHLAAACNQAGCLLVQISTDYVFPGDGVRPYREDDATGPVSAYGRGKLLGEELARGAHEHLILRTSWLCGRGGNNFIEAIRRQIASGKEELRVVDDQTGSPTFCDDLAAMVLDLIGCGARGVVHTANSGATSWHGFACEIARLLGSDITIRPVPTSEFPRPARRPHYSVLDLSHLSSLLGTPPPPWQDGLARYLGAPCES